MTQRNCFQAATSHVVRATRQKIIPTWFARTWTLSDPHSTKHKRFNLAVPYKCVCVYVSRWRLSSMATHVLEFNCVKRHWQGHVAHHVVIVAQIAPTRRCITASTYMYAHMYVCMCMIRDNWVHCICIAIGAKVWANSHMCVCVRKILIWTCTYKHL